MNRPRPEHGRIFPRIIVIVVSLPALGDMLQTGWNINLNQPSEIVYSEAHIFTT